MGYMQSSDGKQVFAGLCNTNGKNIAPPPLLSAQVPFEGNSVAAVSLADALLTVLAS